MLNKKSILLLMICIIMLIIGTLTFANTEDFFTLGKEVKDILESDNNAIVARGQNWEITEAQLDVFTKKYEISYEHLENDSKKYGLDIPYKKTRDDLLKDMIKEEILYEEAISKGLEISKEEAEKVMLQQRKFQIKEHFDIKTPNYEKPKVYPFTDIKEHNFSKYKADDILDYNVTVEPASDIRKKVFSGFEKSCHKLYKFESKPEKDFAKILEQDNRVEKWLRPARGQFNIFWNHDSQQYIPDFVVEIEEKIYIVEIKKEKEIDTKEVQTKAKAALEYCKYASDYTSKNGGKPWGYLLIPHSVVKVNLEFDEFVKEYEICIDIGEKKVHSVDYNSSIVNRTKKEWH